MTEPALSLIVCTYRRPVAVDRLLDAVSQQLRMPDETLVIDASSDAATAQVVRAWQAQSTIPSLCYHRVGPQDQGLTRQRNYAVTLAHGRFIAFLDDDTVPDPAYIQEVLACFARHPDAVGVGGYTDTAVWRMTEGVGFPLLTYRRGNWHRREDYRWRLRRLIRLDSPFSPGWTPPSGHGRPLGFVPPDGEDHEVEFLLGAAFTWRKEMFSRHRFSPYFEGYGLYEDLDFCIKAVREGPLYLCTQARLAHDQAPAGRPSSFRYGMMVVRNGWFVWRRRWPRPPLRSRVGWWVTTVLLALCRFGDAVRGPQRLQSFREALGRLYAMATLAWRPPDLRVP